jgi:hypothetical protein
LGAEKVGKYATVGAKSFLSAGEATIRKGFGFAGSIARKYISINRNSEGNLKQGR